MTADRQEPADYYGEWLGVPPGPRPPDYYALLGLARGEADAGAIKEAARSRMKAVRPRCLKFPQEGTRLLNEIAAAQVCLLDPTRAAAYCDNLEAQELKKARDLSIPDLISLEETATWERPPTAAEDGAALYKVVWDENDEPLVVQAAEEEVVPVARRASKARRTPHAAPKESTPSIRFAVGIDLGITASSIAFVNDEGQVETIRLSQGSLTLPSALYFKESWQAILGIDALRGVDSGAPEAVSGFVRELGNADFHFEAHGKKYAAEDLSALILKELVKVAEIKLASIEGAVFSVPIFFDDNRRQALRKVARLAGINAVEFVDDPVAAAFAYANTRTPEDEEFDVDLLEDAFGEEYVLVYDLAEETFEASVLQLHDRGKFRLIATECEEDLGGRAWDEVVLKNVCAGYKKLINANPTRDRKLMQELRLKAWGVRSRLSEEQTTEVVFTAQGKKRRLQIKRNDFERDTEELLTRTEETLEWMLVHRKLTWDDIDCILLVGEASRMPMVRRMLRRVTQAKSSVIVAPEIAKAQGAALYADFLRSQRRAGR